MELKWYEFEQNNSGGYFDVTDTVCHRLYIEARNDEEAIKKAEELGCYWNGVMEGLDCSCCGDRWYDCPFNVSNLKEFNGDIRAYAQERANKYGWTSPDGRIFHADGKVEEIYIEKTEE